MIHPAAGRMNAPADCSLNEIFLRDVEENHAVQLLVLFVQQVIQLQRTCVKTCMAALPWTYSETAQFRVRRGGLVVLLLRLALRFAGIHRE